MPQWASFKFLSLEGWWGYSMVETAFANTINALSTDLAFC